VPIVDVAHTLCPVRARATLLLFLAVGLAAAITPAAIGRVLAGPTLTTSAGAIDFGSSVVLRGTVPGASAGQEVQILSQACGFTDAVPVGTTKVKAGGIYSFTVQPLLNSILHVQVGDAQSPSRTLTVRPLVQLRKLTARTFHVDVSVGNGAFFTGTVILQRYDLHRKSWKPAGSASLAANSDPAALTAVSSATLRAAVARGTKVRAAVSQATVGSCYRPAVSASVTA
jgi:hypothetical protein